MLNVKKIGQRVVIDKSGTVQEPKVDTQDAGETNLQNRERKENNKIQFFRGLKESSNHFFIYSTVDQHLLHSKHGYNLN